MLEVLVDLHHCDDQDDEVLEQQQGKRSKAKNKTIFMTLEDLSLLNHRGEIGQRLGVNAVPARKM